MPSTLIHRPRARSIACRSFPRKRTSVSVRATRILCRGGWERLKVYWLRERRQRVSEYSRPLRTLPMFNPPRHRKQSLANRRRPHLPLRLRKLLSLKSQGDRHFSFKRYCCIEHSLADPNYIILVFERSRMLPLTARKSMFHLS